MYQSKNEGQVENFRLKHSRHFISLRFSVYLDGLINLNQIQQSAYSSQINSHVPGYFIDVVKFWFEIYPGVNSLPLDNL